VSDIGTHCWKRVCVSDIGTHCLKCSTRGLSSSCYRTCTVYVSVSRRNWATSMSDHTTSVSLSLSLSLSHHHHHHHHQLCEYHAGCWDISWYSVVHILLVTVCSADVDCHAVMSAFSSQSVCWSMEVTQVDH